ncbi:phage integrase SAM-like domain-containing protein [Virgibacillus alimentarius]|nr:phage integrase SAM-like domain-containing protein [Virgibacillus alimentarius]
MYKTLRIVYLAVRAQPYSPAPLQISHLGEKRKYKNPRKNLLNEYLSKVPITDITHYMYQNLLIDLDKRGYARTTISGVNTCANMIFKYAKRNKLIKENPREDVIIPKKKYR